MLCNIEVFGINDTQSVVWPHPSLLNIKYGKPGQSCAEACSNHQMVCTHAHTHTHTYRCSLGICKCVVIHSDILLIALNTYNRLLCLATKLDYTKQCVAKVLNIEILIT